MKYLRTNKTELVKDIETIRFLLLKLRHSVRTFGKWISSLNNEHKRNMYFCTMVLDYYKPCIGKIIKTYNLHRLLINIPKTKEMYLFVVFYRLPCLSSFVQYILRLWDVPISSLRILRICVQNIKFLRGFLSGHEMGRGSDCHLVTRPDVARVPPCLCFFRHFSASNTHYRRKRIYII